jgi:hypothetical protein
MYVLHKSEAFSRNHCCSGKTINIIYCGCVFIALSIQHAKHISHIVIGGLPGSETFFYIISQPALFSKKKVIEPKMCVSILSRTFV